MSYIDFAPYYSKQTRAYTANSGWAMIIRGWLTDNCGVYGDKWEWHMIGSFLAGVYLKDPIDATALKLKFGL